MSDEPAKNPKEPSASGKTDKSRETSENVPQTDKSRETSENIPKTDKSRETPANVPKADANAAKPANVPQIAQTIRIHTDYITLQDLLKLAGAVDTGGEAKIRIQNGEASVNGEPCAQRGKKLRPGDTVSFRNRLYIVGHGR